MNDCSDCSSSQPLDEMGSEWVRKETVIYLKIPCLGLKDRLERRKDVESQGKERDCEDDCLISCRLTSSLVSTTSSFCSSPGWNRFLLLVNAKFRLSR